PQQQHILKASALCVLRGFPQLIAMRNLFIHNIEPAQPFGFVLARPQRSVTIPQTLHLAAGLPVGNAGLNCCCQALRQRGLQPAHAVFPFCCVFFSTATNNFSNASANNLTPSSVSRSVTSFIEMPAF